MKTKFIEFINESKNYNIYKGVPSEGMRDIIESGFVKDSGEWKTPMRRNAFGTDVGISVSRSFDIARNHGTYIIEFDTVKLSDRFRIVPFSENPDYYLDLVDQGKIVKGKKDNKFDWIKKAIRNKEFDKEYWRVKTDTDQMDFGIAEELILADKVPIKYIKKIYVTNLNHELDSKLDALGIDYEEVGFKDKYLSHLKYKDKKVKTYSQK